jgi:methylated-DNA-[protein]-cysteine S-methyltransferase
VAGGGVRFVPPRLGAVPRYRLVESPLGRLLLVTDGHALTSLSLSVLQTGRDRPPVTIGPVWERDDGDGLLADLHAQLAAYFAGSLQIFDTDVASGGTPFQQEVWRSLTAIPYGRTTTYGDLAASLGRPTATRAVGAANGQNPVPIVVPCHRVIGASGKLTGYGLGIEAKHRLLQLEGALL